MEKTAKIGLFVAICVVIAVVALLCFIPYSDDSPITTDDENDYLSFTFPEGGGYATIQGIGDFPYSDLVYYSLDSGDNKEWYTLVQWVGCKVEGGQTIYFKGVNKDHFSFSSTAFYYFELSVNNQGEKVSAHGNVMSLVYGDEYNSEEAKTIPNDYCFYGLFLNCVNLDKAPSLPALYLKKHCYDSMFEGCTSLTTLPAKLPAGEMDLDEKVTGKLAHSCYYEMFFNCKSLTKIPQWFLPAIYLEDYCYDSMFRNCTSLTKVPQKLLPAGEKMWGREEHKVYGKLADYCYKRMFMGCTSLKTSPVLMGDETTGDGCYEEIFKDCTSLVEVTCLTTVCHHIYDIKGWLSNVGKNGIFRCYHTPYWYLWKQDLPRDWKIGFVK